MKTSPAGSLAFPIVVLIFATCTLLLPACSNESSTGPQPIEQQSELTIMQDTIREIGPIPRLIVALTEISEGHAVLANGDDHQSLKKGHGLISKGYARIVTMLKEIPHEMKTEGE